MSKPYYVLDTGGVRPLEEYPDRGSAVAAAERVAGITKREYWVVQVVEKVDPDDGADLQRCTDYLNDR